MKPPPVQPVEDAELVEVIPTPFSAGYNPKISPARPSLRRNGSHKGRERSGHGRGKLRRNISWTDFHGQELHTVVEFEPRCGPEASRPSHVCDPAMACRSSHVPRSSRSEGEESDAHPPRGGMFGKKSCCAIM